ncbi:MAG: N-acetylmuramoyl-L-alanine amidase [Candidatus Riflebacteria bacterium]|nr:N-acetylmuramoyl-L-alanine amidase [Candidatus Riflebacteria bacterium]
MFSKPNNVRFFCLTLFSFFVFLTFTITPANARTRPLKGLFLMLDPGHGGADTGAIGPGGLNEKDVNLRVSRYLKQLLLADGARVMMTREDDTFLSLQERVDILNSHKLDLFVSIHHNATLEKVVKNRGEVFFNAFDDAISRALAHNISDKIVQNGLATESLAIPGGFYLLRNSRCPSVLTEASFMTVPKNEKMLRTGKALTLEAEIIRQAIKEAFEKPQLKVEAVTLNPSVTDSPYFNIIFTSNKPVIFAEIQCLENSSIKFGFEKLPSFGNFYCLYNYSPLPPGYFTLLTRFKSSDNSVSFLEKLKIQVKSGTERIVLRPLSEYIPKNFIGSFPVVLALEDIDGNPLKSKKDFTFSVNGVSGSKLETSEDGKALIFLKIDNNSGEKIELTVNSEGLSTTTISLPVLQTSKTVVMGKAISTLTKCGLEKVKVKYAPNKTVSTIYGGYFFFESAPFFGNRKIEFVPPYGYNTTNTNLKLSGSDFCSVNVDISPVNGNLYGKRIAILAERSHDNWIRPFVKQLMYSGVDVFRLKIPEEAEMPVAEAIKQANLIDNLSLVVSVKHENSKNLLLRHYHRGGTGKKILEALKAEYMKKISKSVCTVTAGSDYELGHTGAPSMVIVLPTKVSVERARKIMEILYSVTGRNI